jgi:hypothetical protein
MFRAFPLLGELRYIYKLPKDEAADRLDKRLAWASRSRLKPFVKFARTIRKHKQGVLTAVQLGFRFETLLRAFRGLRRDVGGDAHGVRLSIPSETRSCFRRAAWWLWRRVIGAASSAYGALGGDP